jgi:hypothetical protein
LPDGSDFAAETLEEGDRRRRSSRPSVTWRSQSRQSLKPLNFKVPAAFHREFKSYAVQHGMSMLDLLREGFQAVKERRGF